MADIYRDYWLNDEAFLKLPLESFQSVIGGNLINICSATEDLFEAVFAVGAVGVEDLQEISELLREHGARPLLNSSSKTTGVCVIVSKQGVRTSLIPIKLANSDINLNSEGLINATETDFLFLTGWLFLPQTTATCQFVSLLLQKLNSDCCVILDMLPHSIDKHTISDEYLAALCKVNVLIAIEATYERIFGSANELQPDMRLSKLRLLLLFKHDGNTGNCYQVEVLNYLFHRRYIVSVTHDINSSPKNYLDRIALEIIVREIAN